MPKGDGYVMFFPGRVRLFLPRFRLIVGGAFVRWLFSGGFGVGSGVWTRRWVAR